MITHLLTPAQRSMLAEARLNHSQAPSRGAALSLTILTQIEDTERQLEGYNESLQAIKTLILKDKYAEAEREIEKVGNRLHALPLGDPLHPDSPLCMIVVRELDGLSDMLDDLKRAETDETGEE